MEQILPQFMERHGLTQKEAARQLGVTPEHLNRIMNGVNPYTWNLVGRIFYFWHIKNFFDGALDMASEIARSVDKSGSDT